MGVCSFFHALACFSDSIRFRSTENPYVATEFLLIADN